MIIGTGIDIVEIERIVQSHSRHAERFEERVFTAAERKERMSAQYMAGRWAAKEAVAKALGCGFCADCGWLDIEVLNDDFGKPGVALSGAAADRAKRLGIGHIHLSISHEKNYACAMAIAEALSSTGKA